MARFTFYLPLSISLTVAVYFLRNIHVPDFCVPPKKGSRVLLLFCLVDAMLGSLNGLVYQIEVDYTVSAVEMFALL
jgi:hypothetical protein